MILSLLGASFVDIIKNEWLGIVASLFVLISFLMTNQVWIRLINMVGCVAFIVYGILLPAYSTAFMNFALLIVHIVYLTRYFVKKNKEKTVPQQENAQAENDDAPSE